MATIDVSDASFRLIYRSRDKIPAADRKVELGSLFTTARANNKGRGVTGALMVSAGWFVQVLEGEEAVVRALFDRIAADPRHDEVTLLDTGVVNNRVFSRWAMAEVDPGGGADVPLIAHTDGIAPAAGRGTTAEQFGVLNVMRSAALLESEVGLG